MRGGFYTSTADKPRGKWVEYDDPWVERAWLGFRVASLPTENAEPSVPALGPFAPLLLWAGLALAGGALLPRLRA